MASQQVVPNRRGHPLRPLPTVLRRFLGTDNGATVIEFAIIAAPFITILFAIFEAALVFFSGQTLENGVAIAARMIRTGEVQTQGISEQQFRTLICQNQPGLVDCANKLRVDVRSFPNFGGVNLPQALDSNGDLNNNFTYQPGAASDVVVVRAFFVWDLLIPDPLTGLSNMGGSRRLIAASAAFRNEPF